jgi:hypothetical protein
LEGTEGTVRGEEEGEREEKETEEAGEEGVGGGDDILEELAVALASR